MSSLSRAGAFGALVLCACSQARETTAEAITMTASPLPESAALRERAVFAAG